MTAPPGSFRVSCVLSTGEVELEFIQAWSPIGYTRAFDLFTDNFFSDEMYFYRCVTDFLVQFGVSNSPAMNEKWGWKNSIEDDPHLKDVKFEKGTISFAGKEE